jgi:flagellar hook assembly protein FlgD
MMTILIFDIKGRQVRQLIANVLIGTENTFTWDGFTDNHTKAASGIYIVYVAVYNPSGEVTHFKKTTILASPLKR